VLDDPREIGEGRPFPYVFVWRRADRLAEVVRMARLDGGPPPVHLGEEWVSVTRPYVTGLDVHCVHALQLIRRRLPCGGEDVFLICPGCENPRRYLYAWEVIGSRLSSRPWHCRSCARLRYRSEGTYIPREWRILGGYPRAETWDPYVFSSLGQAWDVLEYWKR
jgi:hypothetical protein